MLSPANIKSLEKDGDPAPSEEKDETSSVKEDIQLLASSLGDDPDNIEGLVDKFQKSLEDLIKKAGENHDLVLYYSIHLVDSGGQPQFHEIVSIILRAVTGALSVFKLSESLSAHGEVVFYEEGVQTNDPYMSYLTNEQVICHDLLAIQSEACQSDLEELPNLAFVGTFVDQQYKCPEQTPDDKDEHLHSMITEILPKELKQCVISSGGSLRQAMFRVNAKKPSERDYNTAKQLKEALMQQSQVKS